MQGASIKRRQVNVDRGRQDPEAVPQADPYLDRSVARYVVQQFTHGDWIDEHHAPRKLVDIGHDQVTAKDHAQRAMVVLKHAAARARSP